MTKTNSLDDLAQKAILLRSASRSPATKRAYESDWHHFQAWAEANDAQPLPTTPLMVALYLTAYAETLSVSTLERRIAALVIVHRAHGFQLDPLSPAIHDTLCGIRRLHATTIHAKAPLITDELKPILDALPDNLSGTRDRALLLLGHAGAFRRSELVGLDIDDLTFASEGLIVRVRHGKTANERAPEIKGIPRNSDPSLCAVAAIIAWLTRSHLIDGPLFRSIDRFGKIGDGYLVGRAVARILKRAALASAAADGMPKAKAEAWAEQFGAHSLRSGFVTGAASQGGAEWAIQQVTGHKRRATMMRYLRPATALAVAKAARSGAVACAASP